MGTKQNKAFNADELLPIMSGNKIGQLALTKTPLLTPSMERMNFLECRYTRRRNEGIRIGIKVPLEKGAPVGTSLLTNHFNSTGATVPRGMTMEVMKKKNLCSWTICSIRLSFASYDKMKD